MNSHVNATSTGTTFGCHRCGTGCLLILHPQTPAFKMKPEESWATFGPRILDLSPLTEVHHVGLPDVFSVITQVVIHTIKKQILHVPPSLLHYWHQDHTQDRDPFNAREEKHEKNLKKTTSQGHCTKDRWHSRNGDGNARRVFRLNAREREMGPIAQFLGAVSKVNDIDLPCDHGVWEKRAHSAG